MSKRGKIKITTKTKLITASINYNWSSLVETTTKYANS